MNKLENKVAVITGAARGMGETHARLFVQEGAKVVITDILEEQGQLLADELGENALFIKHNVTDYESWENVISKTNDHFGTVSILVNNAGVLGPAVTTEEMDYQDFKKISAINQDGVFLGMKAVIPSMLINQGGSIVNISSAAGLVAAAGSPNVAYVASKFAVTGMTKMAAMEYGSVNIRVNSVHPGAIMTPMAMQDDGAELSGADGFIAGIPLKRMAQPLEVSKMVLFLASDDSSYITGAEFKVDGGVTAK